MIEAYFIADEKNFGVWMIPLLRDLSQRDVFLKIMKHIAEEVIFFNPEAESLFKEIFLLAESSNKIGVFMDFEEERNFLFNSVLKPAGQELGFEVERVDEATLPGEDLHMKIQKMIRTYEIFIVDITGAGKNKFVELGELIALEKNILLLKQSGEDRPFNINHLKMIDYPKASHNFEATKSTHDKLKESIIDGLKKFIDPK